MATSINWKELVKSPQGLVSLAAAAVVALGTAGIINTDLSNALQSLLVALLGVMTAVGHTAASAKVANRQQARNGAPPVAPVPLPAPAPAPAPKDGP